MRTALLTLLLSLLGLPGCPQKAPPEVARVYDGPGVAAEWAEWTSWSLTPEGFPTRASHAFTRCDTGLGLVDFDCSEPPCVAVVREYELGWRRRLASCEPWTEPYGRSFEEAGAIADCGDGRQEVVRLVGSPKTWDWTEDPAPEDPGNRAKRLRFRLELLLDEWSCGAPRENVEAGVAAFEQGSGRAVEWAGEPPDELSAAGFSTAVFDAVRSCRAGVVLLDVDCTEPPCLAMLELRRPDWQARLVERCGAFTEKFGAAVRIATDSIACPDGPRRVAMIGSERTWDYVERPDDPEGWNLVKRLRVRTERAKARVGCD